MSGNKMKTAVMKELGKIEIESREVPEVLEDEVLVKIEYVGICGSDLHYFEQGRIGNFIVEYPFVLGHEAGGVVVKTGSNVKGLQPGDRVALEPGKTCGQCAFCKEGKYNLCPDVEFFATPPVDGVFQEYVSHKAGLCYKLPEQVSTLAGALVEPLAVGFHAANQANAHVGQTAVIMGAGCIGLMTLLALKARGLTQVYVVDVVGKRLEKAMELGAAGVIYAAKEDVSDVMHQLTGGAGCDLVFETAGSSVTVKQAFEIAKKGAEIVLIGYHKEALTPVPLNMALDKELSVKSVFRYRNIYPMAIEALAAGLIDAEMVVTNFYSLEEAQKAMTESIEKKDEIIKSVIRM